jgi:hypothetical protein
VSPVDGDLIPPGNEKRKKEGRKKNLLEELHILFLSPPPSSLLPSKTEDDGPNDDNRAQRWKQEREGERERTMMTYPFSIIPPKEVSPIDSTPPHNPSSSFSYPPLFHTSL